MLPPCSDATYLHLTSQASFDLPAVVLISLCVSFSSLSLISLTFYCSYSLISYDFVYSNIPPLNCLHFPLQSDLRTAIIARPSSSTTLFTFASINLNFRLSVLMFLFQQVAPESCLSKLPALFTWAPFASHVMWRSTNRWAPSGERPLSRAGWWV